MSNLIETSSIKPFQSITPNAPQSTPLSTPPYNSPSQSPIIGSRIQRSNSACISNSSELLPCRYNTKLISKRRNTQLLQANDPSFYQDTTSIHYAHRLQSLRTIAAGAQKSSNLISKGLLKSSNLNREFRVSLDEDEMDDNYLKNSLANEASNDTKQINGESNDEPIDKLSENMKRVKLVAQSNERSDQFVNRSPPKKSIEKKIKSGQDIDELIKENKINETVQDNVKKMIETAQMRKNQLQKLLDEHQSIVQQIKLAERRN